MKYYVENGDVFGWTSSRVSILCYQVKKHTKLLKNKILVACDGWRNRIFSELFYEEDVLDRETSSTLYSEFEVLDTIGYDAKFVGSDDSGES